MPERQIPCTEALHVARLDELRETRTIQLMRTVIETPDIPEAGREAVVRRRATGLHRLDCGEPAGRGCDSRRGWSTQGSLEPFRVW